jgi:hypothetical protein
MSKRPYFDRNGEPHRAQPRKRALTFAACLAVSGLFAPVALAVPGRYASVDLVTRADGQILPAYARDGRHWVIGTPGREYSIRVCNTTGARVLAVMSVDGVNVITGDTASPAQSGYVLGAWECADIGGWRKSLSRTAAFYFTELPDAYATRTGRPENVGVIGVAMFPEKRRPAAPRPWPGKFLGDARNDGAATAAQAPAEAAAERQAADASAAASGGTMRNEPAPAAVPQAKLGTGHGRSEHSPAQMVAFERASDAPAETIAIHYDRRENLMAMGILPPPVIAGTPNPFPSWTPRFAPDPPR